MRYQIPALILAAHLAGSAQAADVFDQHTSKLLKKGIAGKEPLKSLSLEEAGRLKTMSAKFGSPCIVVETNDGNITKALVGWGFRRSGDKLIPVLLIERFVTYRHDRGNVAAAAGKEVMLFSGFQFNFDIGQVVPDGQGADIRFTKDGKIEPVENAKLYGLNGSQVPKDSDTDGPSMGTTVLPRDFAGSWKINVDGRWSGEMELQLDGTKKLRGKYTSTDSKSTYNVTGRIASLPYHAKLTIHLDNANQTIDGYLFTRDKSVMAGFSTIAGRNFGFRATREPR